MGAVMAALNALSAILGSESFKRIAPAVGDLIGRDQGLTPEQVQNILSNINDYNEHIAYHTARLPGAPGPEAPTKNVPPGHPSQK